MLHDDPVYLLRLQAMSAAQQLGSVQLACRMLDISRSTFYRWRRRWLRYGPEILRPRERREPRMANATPPFVEEQVVAFALAHPASVPVASATNCGAKVGQPQHLAERRL